MRGTMKKSTRDIVCILVIGLAAMFALPAAYRVWIHYNPPPERKPFSDVLREAGGIRREALLAIPLDKWSEADVKLAPDIREWLAARSDVILPWEWSEEARKKDWKGYCDSWRRVLDDQSDALEELVDKKTSMMEGAADKAQELRKAVAEGQEQATNSLATAEALERERDKTKADIADLTKAREGVLESTDRVAAARKAGYMPGKPTDGLFKSLQESISAEYRHRLPRRKLPKWLPGKVRKWFSMSAGRSESACGFFGE